MPKSATPTPKTDSLALVRAHQSEIWRYLRYLGCDPTDAEDLAQDTFLAVLRRPFEDRGPIQTAGYLRRVAHNLFLKSRRRQARQPQFTSFEDGEAIWRTCCGRDGGDQYVEELRDCVTKLDGRGRSVVSLRYGLGRSRGEIATTLGMSLDGVKSLLRRVREILRTCVERRMSR